MGSEHTFVDITVTDVHGLLERAEEALTREDFEQLYALVKTLIELTRLVREKGSTIARLRRLMGLVSSEKTADVLGDDSGRGHQEGSGTADRDGEGETQNGPREDTGANQQPGDKGNGRARRKQKGHGRIPASAYKAALQISVGHQSLSVGAICPACEKGKLNNREPVRIVRIFGQSPLVATCWSLERLRCNGCGEVFVAQAPPEARGSKYDETAVSMMALLRYDVGMPLNRLQRLQAELETPLPATTQWDVVSGAVSNIAPVYNELARLAASGSLVQNDDTYMRVLELMGSRREKLQSAGKLADPDRTGLFTTAIVSHTDSGPIVLFFTGRNHAGENLSQLLDSRATDLPPPIQMCDALDRNLPKGHEVVEANCLCHGRRNVLDEIGAFPSECRHILESLAKVFHNEKTCKETELSDEERLRFHQRHSKSVMDDLETWMNERLEKKLIEPNSGMGKALNYLLRRWDKLTLFLRVPGAPLENNTCERALKMAITHRKNSLFYRSERGALVGDTYMSVIYTARLHKVNPFDFLTALQRYSAFAAKSPADWLPWTYRSTLDLLRHSNAA